MYRTSLLIVSFVFIVLLFNPSPGWAQQEQDRLDQAASERLQDALQAEKGKILTPAGELIEQLKQRALRKKEEARREQLRATKGTIGLHLGYDNNANTDSDRKGGEYLEQYFSYNWTSTFSDYLGAEIGPWYYSDLYKDVRDLTIFDWAFKALLKYFPTGEPHLELQPGIERQWIHYPECDTSSYIEDKAFFKVKHKFWERWSQEAGYEYSFQEYDKKQPRAEETISASYMPGMVVEKDKHSFSYDVSFPWGKNNLKFKQKFYKEVSNDQYRQYYDMYSYKATTELGRSLTQKLYAKAALAYERKNYCHRTVTNLNEAEYDDVYTRNIYFYYTLKKDWTLSYTFTHKTSTSNDNLYDYDKASHLACQHCPSLAKNIFNQLNLRFTL